MSSRTVNRRSPSCRVRSLRSGLARPSTLVSRSTYPATAALLGPVPATVTAPIGFWPGAFCGFWPAVAPVPAALGGLSSP